HALAQAHQAERRAAAVIKQVVGKPNEQVADQQGPPTDGGLVVVATIAHLVAALWQVNPQTRPTKFAVRFLLALGVRLDDVPVAAFTHVPFPDWWCRLPP